MNARDGVFKLCGTNKVACWFIWVFFVLRLAYANIDNPDQLQDELHDVSIEAFNDMPKNIAILLWDLESFHGTGIRRVTPEN
ncbi:uncharacterized protein AC631_01341 [Debaryomyces fabryi]|uniref:Uncharacterized protein n=1 Tax=Debaryomyces fabryi TaxID=58627 RepID=A0A0V1Q2Z1_9ASCO|nr:uncharacterized protein AC631_01341 [Debaryomyces fabryi]KSA02861.1 hypothetical protein AC631_01341 [Debaryomyces fabryi]